MIKKAFKKAFPYTIPVMAGYLFLGLTYGVYMRVSGFSFIYPMITSVFVYGGSLEFMIVSMFLSAFAPFEFFVMALMIQARHIFYGIAMLKKYEGLGIKKIYLIFGLSDETFALTSSIDVPDDVDKGWFYVFITWLDRFYWFLGCSSGAILGSFINFNTKGLDFVMTAMFVVIMINQWLKDDNHISALIGLFASLICLFIFGASSFLIPTMILIVILMTVFKGKIEGEV